ncbi:MAG: membrane protein insertase YidC [Bacteroidales bacterium]|nr:membrane protein insertase YidC [Bacteroidales bacterium]
MNKNNITGFVLIGIIIIGFTWYNGKQAEEQRKQQHQRDSIAHVERMALLREQYLRDSIAALSAPAPMVVTPEQQQEVLAQQMGSELAAAMDKEEEFYSLENELINLSFTNKGGRIYAAQIKNFHTHDSLPILLFDGAGNDFSLHLFTKQQISTGNFFFEAVTLPDPADSLACLTLRLTVSEAAYIEYVYTLPRNSYKLNFDINLVGMNNEIPRNVSGIDLHWLANLRTQEKNFSNESNYSTVAYKYPGTDEIETLAMRSDAGNAKLTTRIEWVAFKLQFFSAILAARDNFVQGEVAFQNYPDFQKRPDLNPNKLLMQCESTLQLAYNNSEMQTIPLAFYFMPNQYRTLKAEERSFEKLVYLGWWIMGYINRLVIIPVFNLLNKFISNYGIIILLLTIFIKLVLLPLTHKSHVSMAKMKVLKPEVDKINEKYPKKEDAMKKQQEVMALYKRTGVSMLGGCIPMLLQMPILIAMFNFFPASFELRQKGFLWADDLSTYDSVLSLPFDIPMYGNHVSLFVLLMAISMFFYSRVTLAQTATSNQMPGMKFMQLYFMPIFMLLIFNSYSSGLSYYFMLSNFITIGQTWVIRKWFVDEDELLRKMKERAAQPQKKSKFQQRLEDMQRQQQQQRQKRR